MTVVALLGSTGFVGMQVALRLEGRGAEVRRVHAPRLSTGARDLDTLVAELDSARMRHVVRDLAAALVACDVVVNAAGVAAATGHGDDIYGADALLPGIVALAAPTGARVVHVSSAAVQGRRSYLDETTSTEPFSPYSHAKALGEHLLRQTRPDAVSHRPTSVQGRGRPVTASLVRFARSPLASVAGDGAQPSPQVLVENVADACAFLALADEQPPQVVLQAGEGISAAGLMSVLGGKDPVRVPAALARLIVGIGFAAGRWSSGAAGLTRRLEVLWFGQRQLPGWLDGRWAAPMGLETWKDLA